MINPSDKITAYIHYQATGPIEIEVPYNSQLVNQIKTDISFQQRKWDPSILCTDDEHHRCKGRWIVNRNQLDEVRRILKIFHNRVIEIGPDSKQNFMRTGV